MAMNVIIEKEDNLQNKLARTDNQVYIQKRKNYFSLITD